MTTQTPLGDRSKNGVIIKAESFSFYNGLSDGTLTPVLRPRDGATVRTTKVTEGPVTMANNQYTVTMYPDGRMEIVPNA